MGRVCITLNIIDMQNLIKIVLAILLFSCLLELPYGYFQFVRFVSMVGFVYLAYTVKEENKKQIAVVWAEIQSKYASAIFYLVLALLFQPLLKISLGRQLWNIIDVIVGLGLIASIFLNKKK